MFCSAGVKEGEMLESASPSDPFFWMIHPILDRMTAAKRLAEQGRPEEMELSSSSFLDASEGVRDVNPDFQFGSYGPIRGFTDDKSWLDYSFYDTNPVLDPPPPPDSSSSSASTTAFTTSTSTSAATTADTAPLFSLASAAVCTGHGPEDAVLGDLALPSSLIWAGDSNGDGALNNVEFYAAVDPLTPLGKTYVFDHFRWDHCDDAKDEGMVVVDAEDGDEEEGDSESWTVNDGAADGNDHGDNTFGDETTAFPSADSSTKTTTTTTPASGSSSSSSSSASASSFTTGYYDGTGASWEDGGSLKLVNEEEVFTFAAGIKPRHMDRTAVVNKHKKKQRYGHAVTGQGIKSGDVANSHRSSSSSSSGSSRSSNAEEEKESGSGGSEGVLPVHWSQARAAGATGMVGVLPAVEAAKSATALKLPSNHATHVAAAHQTNRFTTRSTTTTTDASTTDVNDGTTTTTTTDATTTLR